MRIIQERPFSRELLLVAGLAMAITQGCATSRTAAPNGDASEDPRSLSDVLRQDLDSYGSPYSQGNTGMSSKGEIYIRGVKLQNTQFDYPVTVNSRVEYWIDYFTGRGRKHFQRYLERSELFIPYITPLLKQNGMPEDLVYLAMIESGFNNHARSHAKAVGPWQFISATGKRYGLMVNWWVDERRDTRKSTLAAVQYLKDLYSIFGSWELAAAAYNAGEAKIARAVRRFGTKDFWVISRQRFLRPETRDYVPKIMAAAIVAKNRTQFGFSASTIHPGEGEAISPGGEVVKVEKQDENAQPTPVTSSGEVADANDYENAPEEDDAEATPATLTIPAENAAPEGTLAGAPLPAASQDAPLAKPVPTPNVSKKGEVSGEELAEFEVQSPADILKIARAAGLSYHTVKALNPELLRWCTPPMLGSFRVKLPASAKEKFLATYNHSAYPRQVTFLTHKVRRGETVAKIARRYGIKVDPISDLNGVSPRMPLRSGVRVLLPMPNDRSRTLASLEVRDPPEKRRYRKYRKGGGRFYKVSYKRRSAARSGTPVVATN